MDWHMTAVIVAVTAVTAVKTDSILIYQELDNLPLKRNENLRIYMNILIYLYIYIYKK
jgi:hypothetical protein